MSASVVVVSPIKSHTQAVESGLEIQEYLIAYDAEMRRQAEFKRMPIDDSLFCGVATDLYLNGKHHPLALDDMSRPLNDGESLIIEHRPQAFGSAILIGIIAASVAVLTLLAPPSIPSIGQDGGREESPNNRLSGQTNTARPYQAIPEIFGNIRAFPDLIQPSVYEYINNIKYVREVFCIGRGEYQINAIRDDRTDIEDVAGASATVYGPNTSPSDLVIGRDSNDIDGQEFISPNDPRIAAFGRIIFYSVTGSGSFNATFDDGTQTITLDDDQALFKTGLELGDSFDVSGSLLNNGTYTISSISSNGSDTVIGVGSGIIDEGPLSITITSNETIPSDVIYFTNTSVVENFNLQPSSEFVIADTLQNGTYTINTISTTSIKPSAAEAAFNVVAFSVVESFTYEDDASGKLENPELSQFIGWFQMPGQMDSVWCHVQSPQGLQNEEGNTIQVNFTIEVELTDINGTPSGTVTTATSFVRGGSLDPIFKTVKVALPQFGYYRIRAYRTTNKYSGNSVDLLKFEEAFAITEYTSDFGDVTLLDVTTKATLFALNSSQRKINVDCTRKLGTARTGAYDPTLTATKSFADAVLYTLLEGGRSIDEIDIDELYDIEQRIGSPFNEFSFSFDGKDIDLGERVKTICNAARVNVYRDGQTWRFVRDEARTSRTLSFNRRNIASGENQKQSYKLRKPNDFNGITLRYIDPQTDKRAEVLITIDPVTETFIEGQLASRPQNIDLAGCRNELQARDRAHLEARRQLYQRRSVSETVLSDGNLVDLGDRVAWVDIFDGETFDGEILSVNGTTYTTSERFDPAAGESYVVVITDSDGNTTDPVSCTSGDDPFSFIADIAAAPIIADRVNIQAGSRYIIGNVNDISDTDMTVVSKKPDSEGRVAIQMINYTDKLYSQDGNLA